MPNEFHAAVDTNNGTEESAKVQIYAKTESRNFVSLLVRRFLPEAQQSYVLPNLKASEWYRHYNDFVPRFLRGRPRSVILHCLNKQSRSNKYHGGDLREGGKEGVFTLQKTDGTKHVVDFGRSSQD